MSILTLTKGKREGQLLIVNDMSRSLGLQLNELDQCRRLESAQTSKRTRCYNVNN